VSDVGARLPQEAWAMALSLLPGCGHHRLRAVLDAFGGDAEQAWTVLAGGASSSASRSLVAALGAGGSGVVDGWRKASPSVDPEAAWRAVTRDGVGVWVLGRDGYPAGLVEDPDPSPILFWRGDPQALERPAVAIVGTRRCTAYGSDVARQLGRDLATAGVAVVSGLALGIDGAAHEGALAAHLGATDTDGEGPGHLSAGGPGAGPPIGVVGSGLDVVYPPRHRHLWRRVAHHGLLLTEAPPGGAPEAWRFPRRNRILAGLADVVVVVESHASGGSLSTVRAALDRDITVMAVPGSVRSPSSAGTNRLLADGVAPVTDADDVLVALSLTGANVTTTTVASCTAGTTERGPEPPVLAAGDWTPTSTEANQRRTGLTLGEASTELTRLEVQGRLRRRGGWWERVDQAR
jgi:DNA processing protein